VALTRTTNEQQHRGHNRDPQFQHSQTLALLRRGPLAGPEDIPIRQRSLQTTPARS